VGLEQRFVDTNAEAIRLEFQPAPRLRSAPIVELALKRVLDVVLAGSLLALLAPLLLATAILIRLDSKGAVLFRQTRLGRGGQPFEILKFRSMHVLENGACIVQATKDDPRVTRIGRVLRKTSIDELPQLFNVLKGDMSLVGPRPHARAHDEYYAQVIDNYAGRQAMKPGITGWAQVQGFRGETPTVESMRRRVECDLWYVAHFNLLLDIEILFRTAFEVFRQRNAH
jgi:exopolysaccharide biosynthesis polyprenyl glycosylphosphotransferase